MPPRASRAKAAAATPKKTVTRGKRSDAVAVEEEEESASAVVQPDAADEEEKQAEPVSVTPPSGKGKGKGKAKAVEQEAVTVSAEEADEPQGSMNVNGEKEQPDAGDDVSGRADASGSTAPKLSAEERLAKLKELRIRMNHSSAQNRKDLIADHQKTKTTQSELARLEKQRKLAEMLREKIDADENGEDLDRKKAWGYTLEDQEKWDERTERKKESGQFEFDDQDSNAQRKYIKNIRSLKPDMLAYNRQKEAALGLAPGTLVPLAFSSSGSSKALLQTGSLGSSGSRALTAAENLYRDGKTMAYGDNKPSDEAIDKVLEKMNKDLSKGQKAQLKRKNAGDEGDVTYINEANKVFNKKVNRYFDKYTQEIRANFERGTAL